MTDVDLFISRPLLNSPHTFVNVLPPCQALPSTAVRVSPRVRVIPILEVVVIITTVLSILKTTTVDFVSHLENVAQGQRIGLGFDPVWFVQHRSRWVYCVPQAYSVNFVCGSHRLPWYSMLEQRIGYVRKIFNLSTR